MMINTAYLILEYGTIFEAKAYSIKNAVAAVLNGFCDKDSDIKVQHSGGDLIIRYTDYAMYMTGEYKKVFDGTVEI